jgi:4-amino-4-deoxy-L-arabinose transferase-like glycosyltransferase
LRFVTERPALVLAIGYLALALHGLGAADIVGDDEAREAGIVQAIVAGHWLLPRFNGELLPDKPIGYHWLAALPCAAAGFSEVAVRLPSALAGAALVGWIATAGAALVDPPGALVAAALLATMPGFFDRARVARPDALLVLLLSVALVLAFRWWRDARPSDATRALALLGFATLAKGPVAPVLFVAVLGGFLAWQRQLRRLPRLLTGPGVLAFAVLGLGWYAVALAGWGDEFVREHLLGRYVGNLIGGLGTVRTYSSRPLAYHLLFYAEHLPLVALPWTPLVAVALWRAGRTRGFADPRLRFLVCWMLAPVVVFTPAEYKLRYYLLPALPAMALLAATALRGRDGAPRRLDWRVLAAVGVAAVAVTAAAWAVLGGRLSLSRSDRATLAAILPLVPGGARGAATAIGFAAGVLAVAVALRAWRATVALVALAAALWLAVAQPGLAAAVAARDSLKGFARDAAARFPPPSPLVFWRDTIRPVAVYVGRPVPTVTRREALAPGTAVIATETGYREIFTAGLVGAPVTVARGRLGNITRGWAVLAVQDAPSR